MSCALLDMSFSIAWVTPKCCGDNNLTLFYVDPRDDALKVYSFLVHFWCIWNSSNLGDFQIHRKLKGIATPCSPPSPTGNHCQPAASSCHRRRCPPPLAIVSHHRHCRCRPPPRPPSPAVASDHCKG
ncbi:hypothetical protein IEQ34_014818 [Dendrobium chrysotoxum]|uniref:Uncharacterized protein n=1 Tax=Dendrobium chrysotoxum TaxID=161865 RepID=A0AAV7GKB9_DENCH|nr:hypothetical protein IEQ34_014818 [Dendrobium chrysotoxum]